MTDAAWTDQPVLSGEKDNLGRLPYAQRAADLIFRTHSFETSAVFGLSGPWGSGKTSLVNMIVDAKFTPWATSDVAGLLAEFHASLSEVLPKKKGEQVRRALAATAKVAAPAANLIPVVGTAAAESVRVAADALAKVPSWEAAFAKASAELKSLGRPILVVVDDIDRLHVDELMALLKVVRLLGRFDGVQYLLAYDDETLYRSMRSSNVVDARDGSAERFMEKIVQYPLFVPPMLRHQQLARLNDALSAVTRVRAEDGVSEGRLGGLVDCFVSLLMTPRAIDRYIAQLRHHVPLLPPSEVDDEDVLLLTLIRVSFPAMFNALPRYRAELVSGHTGKMLFDRKQLEYELFDVAPLLAVVPEGQTDIARRLLAALFPKIRGKDQLGSHASGRRQSVQHEEYFDRYFAMGILGHDVSDVEVGAAVEAAARGDADPLKHLLIDSSAEVQGLVLSKGDSPSNHPPDDAGRLRLAQALADIANGLPSDETGPFSPQDRILSWVGGQLASLNKNTSAGAVLAVVDALAHVAVRIRTWKRVEYRLEDARDEHRPTWYDETTARLVDAAAVDFLNHLALGDAAPTAIGVAYQAHFVLQHEPERLRTRVAELLRTGETNLSTLASRLTSAQTMTGIKPDWKLSTDFDQDTFNRLAPVGDDPWYAQPREEVDVRDLSWANRRRFAAGRVTPPPPDTAELGQQQGV